jgi:serine/threonine protein kinase
MRSLHTRLAKSGRLDIFTTGRYLDQISTTLEYAHQNAMIHGNLSVDGIYIRLDGQLVVSDFGVRDLLPMESVGMLNAWSGAWTPEQLLGKPVGTYTDV